MELKEYSEKLKEIRDQLEEYAEKIYFSGYAYAYEGQVIEGEEIRDNLRKSEDYLERAIEKLTAIIDNQPDSGLYQNNN